MLKEQCLSVYWGEWPWRELHLVASSIEAAQVWRRDLQAIVDNLPHSEESSIDYWLRCVYVELFRQGSGSVHALTALSNFGGVRMWRAYDVRNDHLYELYNFSALAPLDTIPCSIIIIIIITLLYMHDL